MMRKILVTLIMVVTMVFASAVAFAGEQTNSSDFADLKKAVRVTNGASDFLGIGEINMTIMVRTLEGDNVSGLHKFKTVEEADKFLKGEKEDGLRVTNSKKPKRNLVIIGAEDAKLLAKLAKMANNSTAQAVEGPLYQVEVLETSMPAEFANKLHEVGINQPVVLVVDSSKKVRPGGAMGAVTNFLNPIRMATGVYNDIWSVVNWN